MYSLCALGFELKIWNISWGGENWTAYKRSSFDIKYKFTPSTIDNTSNVTPMIDMHNYWAEAKRSYLFRVGGGGGQFKPVNVFKAFHSIAFQWEAKKYDIVQIFDILEFLFMKNINYCVQYCVHVLVTSHISVLYTYVFRMFLQFWPLTLSGSTFL